MPFKSEEEKRAFIENLNNIVKEYYERLDEEDEVQVDRPPFFSEAEIDRMVKDTSKYERYQTANKFLEMRIDTEQSKKAFDFLGDVPAIQGTMRRLIPLLYNYSDTPEAKRWNAYYKEMLNSEDAPKRLFKMCVGIMLRYDDSVLTKSTDEVFKAWSDDTVATYVMFSAGDLSAYAKTLEETSTDPADIAVINAFKEKHALTHEISKFDLGMRAQGSLLGAVLPDNISQEKLQILSDAMSDYAARKMDGNEGRDFALPATEMASWKRTQTEFEQFQKTSKVLLQNKLIGPEGIYHRAYRNTPQGKKYLTKNDVFNALAKGESVDGIRVEEVPKDVRSYLDEYKEVTVRPGCTEAFPEPGSKEKHIEAFRPVLEEETVKAIKESNADLTDEQAKEQAKKIVDGLINDASNDVETARAAERLRQVTQTKLPYSATEQNTLPSQTAARLPEVMYIKGNSPEIKKWNENVKYMIQTGEGMNELTKIAAKKLLSIDIKVFAEQDQAKREQYLLEHPLEANIMFLANNIILGYGSMLPPEKKANDPVLKALEVRQALCESFGVDKSKMQYDASKFMNLLEKATGKSKDEYSFNERIALQGQLGRIKSQLSGADGIPKDPEQEEILAQAIGDMSAGIGYALDVKEKPYRQNLKKLIDQGIIRAEDNIYQGYEAEFEKPHKEGEPVEYEKRTNLSIDALIEGMCAGEIKEGSIKSVPVIPEDRARIQEFMDTIPDEPTVYYTDQEKAELDKLANSRTVFKDNTVIMDNLRSDFKDVKDPELTALLSSAKGTSVPEKRAEALKNAFEYVNNNRLKNLSDPLDKDKMDVALAIIASVDGNCAKSLVERINVERESCFFAKTPLDLNASMERFGIKPGTDPYKEIYRVGDPMDRRLENLKEVYLHLREDLDPWYHKNGSAFKEMMKSMETIMEYGTTSASRDKATLELMFKDVEEASKKYLMEKDARTSLGTNRKSAALAAVAALNPSEASKLVHTLNVEKRTWAAKLCEEINQKPGMLTTRAVLNREKMQYDVPSLGELQKDIEGTRREVFAAKTLEERIDLTAEYFVKKRLKSCIMKSMDDAAAKVAADEAKTAEREAAQKQDKAERKVRKEVERKAEALLTASKKQLAENVQKFQKSEAFAKAADDIAKMSNDLKNNTGVVDIDLDAIDHKMLDDVVASNEKNAAKAEQKQQIAKDAENVKEAEANALGSRGL